MSLSPTGGFSELLGIIGAPYAAQRRTEERKFEGKLFGRKYLGGLTVSDQVTVPYGRDFYLHSAEDDPVTTVEIDGTGERSGRDAPPDGFTYAIVNSPSYSLFWDRVTEATAGTDPAVNSEQYIEITDEHVRVYGIPENAERIPEPESPLV